MNFDWTSLCEEDFHKLKETKTTVASKINFVSMKTNFYVTWGKMKIKIEKKKEGIERDDENFEREKWEKMNNAGKW